MKKTLLIVAAALAAGMISTQAQNVYSQNIVGYYNITVPANGYAFIANQLVQGSDSAQTNNDIQTVLSNGFTSDVNAINNSTLYRWNGSGYTLYQYFNQSDANNYWGNNVAGWYDLGGSLASGVSLGLGGGHFIYNPTGSPLTNTVVGVVNQGTNVLQVTPGFNTYAIIPPVSAALDSTLVNFPGTSDVNGLNNDVYYQWNGTGFTLFQYFNQSDANNYWGNNVAGWYDLGGSLITSAAYPKVGQGFFINHITGGTLNWTNSFVAP